MLKAMKIAAAAVLAVGLTGAAQAAPELSSFDVHSADGWAQKLALCDTTAFLNSHPDLNSNIMFVRRDDARRFDMLLPPDFVGGGQWYEDGYERLYHHLRQDKKVSADEMLQAQNTVGRDFVEAYRASGGRLNRHFLNAQDTYCRAMARAQGVIVS